MSPWRSQHRLDIWAEVNFSVLVFSGQLLCGSWSWAWKKVFIFCETVLMLFWPLGPTLPCTRWVNFKVRSFICPLFPWPVPASFFSFFYFFYSRLFLLCCINLFLCFTSGSPSLTDILFCFTAMVSFQSHLRLSPVHFISLSFMSASHSAPLLGLSPLCYLQE